MTFVEFQDYLVEHILEGWLEDHTVEIHKITKNNGIIYTGLYIKKEADRSVPSVYLEQYYERYQNGESVEEIKKAIRKEYEWARGQVPECKIDVLSFEGVRDCIIYRLVNYERNKELLQSCPYIRLYDLAVTFRWIAHFDEVGLSTALITEDELEKWGVSLGEILLVASENTPRIFPVRMMKMDDMLKGLCGCRDLASGQLPMYIITNEQEVNGATTILYNSVLENFAKLCEEDFFILPSSIHEMIFVPAGYIDCPEDLGALVREINETIVDCGDVLSDSVYYYSKKENKMRVYE